MTTGAAAAQVAATATLALTAQTAAAVASKESDGDHMSHYQGAVSPFGETAFYGDIITGYLTGTAPSQLR